MNKRAASPTLWDDIKASLAGSDLDYTSGSIGRAILILSIPMVLEMFMESIFAVVDIFFVARLGAQAVATVGITESLLTLIYAIAIGLSMATTAIVSRRYGEKNKDEAAVSGVQAIIISTIISVPVSVAGILWGPDLLRLMGAEAEVIDQFSDYTTIMIGGNMVIMWLFVNNAIFRGAGDAAVAMRSLWLANGINIVLDPLLIFGIWIFPELGIKGAAIATVTGRFIGVLYQWYKITDSKGRITIRKSHFAVQKETMIRLIRVSLGGIGQFLIATSSWIGLVRIIAEFGSEALAGYTIAIRVVVFSILPSWGMSNAAATLVGQNLGAGKPERAEKSTWVSAGINMIFLGFIGLVFLLFAENFIRIFTNNTEVIIIGAKCLTVMSYGYLAYGFGMVVIQAFNGAGDTYTPTVINFICFWMIQIPLAYVLAMELGFAEEGVFYSIVVSESLLGVIGFILFRRGKWKQTKI